MTAWIVLCRSCFEGYLRKGCREELLIGIVKSKCERCGAVVGVFPCTQGAVSEPHTPRRSRIEQIDAEHTMRAKDLLTSSYLYLDQARETAREAALLDGSASRALLDWLLLKCLFIWFDRRLRAIEKKLDLDSGEP